VLFEPLAAEMALIGNGNGYANGNGNGNGHGNGHGNGNGNGNGYTQWTPGQGAGPGQAVQPAYPTDPANGGELVYEGNGRRSRRQVILVVSPGTENTRSTVVANLAAVYAEAGAQALVVSMGDLRWGRASTTPVSASEGEKDIDPEDLVPLSTPSAVDGVARLQFDQLLASRGQVVTQGPAIITAARQVADTVLIDAPSLLRAHDAIALLPAVDVVLLVAQYSVTRSDEAREAGDMLRRFRAPVLGVAFTNVPGRTRGPRVKDVEPQDAPREVVLESYDAPQPAPTATATGRLWL